MTQKVLGDKTGINEANIRKYEFGSRKPKPLQINKIAQALGIPTFLLENNRLITFTDILASLIELDEAVGLKFNKDDPRDENGQLNPENISIKITNDDFNKFLAKWEAIRHEHYTKVMKRYGDYSVHALLEFHKDMEYKKACEVLLLSEAEQHIESIDD